MKHILYSGYANSGGTIIGLIFNEIDRAVVLPMEFRLLKERCGLIELEDALFKTMDPEIIDLALKDFEWLCVQYSNPIGRFKRAGYSYEERSGNTFNAATKNYVDSLIDFKYPKSWHYYDFKLSLFSLLKNRAIRKILRSTDYGALDAYLSFPSRKIFIEKTRDYLREISHGFLHQQAIVQNKQAHVRDSFLVLPKSIPLYSNEAINQISKYFDDCKMILIDRDPRDVFIEITRGKRRYLPVTNSKEIEVEGFIKYFESLRSEKACVARNPSVLMLQFEDVVMNYDSALDRMYQFLDISPSSHTRRGSLFKPEVSMGNIGLWRELEGEDAKAIRLIETRLSHYLYDPAKP